MGTKALKIAYDIIFEDQATQLAKIHPIFFDLKGTEAPMIVGYDHGRFVWGYEAKRLIEAGTLKEHNHLSLLKLALYSDANTSPIQLETRQKLDQMGKTLEEVLEQTLTVFIEYAKENIKKHAHNHNIDTLPTDLFITVPQVWTPVANRKMTMAATLAGADSIRLVYEPECAAAFVIAQEFATEVEGRIDHWLSVNDAISVADIGGGTADLISFKLASSPRRAAKVVLNVQKQPEGFLCASEFVNRRFLNWLQSPQYLKNEGELKQQAAELQISLQELLDSASREFEKQKVDYNPFIPVYSISIPGIDGKEYKIKFDRATMRSFFEGLIDEIVKHLDAQITSKTRVIMVPGGFGKCVPFIDHIRERYKSKGIRVFDSRRDFSNAVSRGTLLRHRNTTVKDFYTQSQWGFRWDMEFHPQLHPDAVLTYTADSATKKNDAKRCIMKQDDIEDEYESDCVIIRSKRRTQPHRKSTRNPKSMKLSADDHEGECELDNFAQNGYDIDPNIVFNDPFNKCEVVLDRLCWLNQKGTPITDKSTFQSPYEIQERFLPVEGLEGGDTITISEDIYWTDSALDNSIPLYPDPQKPGQVRSDVHKWATIIKTVSASNYDWKAIQDDEGEYWYKIYCRLAMRYEGPNVEFAWELGDNASSTFDGNGLLLPDAVDAPVSWSDIAEGDKHELSSRKNNPFVVPNKE